MGKFSNYEYRNLPGFDMKTFAGANQAIPMKTLVIHCLDPRAVEIPQAVAEYFGDEVYPGEIITDENGTRVGSTRTLVVETNAGGRAAFALESVADMDYIFNVKNVVVVHHSFCGTTTLTAELIVEEFHHHHHHADISTLFDHDSLAIMDLEESLNYDIRLLRESAAVPEHIKLYGFFYEISSGKLTEVVRDIPAVARALIANFYGTCAGSGGSEQYVRRLRDKSRHCTFGSTDIGRSRRALEKRAGYRGRFPRPRPNGVVPESGRGSFTMRRRGRLQFRIATGCFPWIRER